MKERIHVYPEEDTGGFIAVALDYPKCQKATGRTSEEAVENIRIPLLLEKAINALEGKAADATPPTNFRPYFSPQAGVHLSTQEVIA